MAFTIILMSDIGTSQLNCYLSTFLDFGLCQYEVGLSKISLPKLILNITSRKCFFTMYTQDLGEEKLVLLEDSYFDASSSFIFYLQKVIGSKDIVLNYNATSRKLEINLANGAYLTNISAQLVSILGLDTNTIDQNLVGSRAIDLFCFTRTLRVNADFIEAQVLDDNSARCLAMVPCSFENKAGIFYEPVNIKYINCKLLYSNRLSLSVFDMEGEPISIGNGKIVIELSFRRK